MRATFALLLGAASCLAAPPVRVAVLSVDPADSSAIVAKEISKLEGVAVVHQRLDPKPDQNALSTNEGRKTLGVLFSAHLLLLVDAGNSFAYVDAGTGGELFRIREETPEALARSAFLLVEELRDAERIPKIFIEETAGAQNAAAPLRDWLREAGLNVLETAPPAKETAEKTALPPPPGGVYLLKIKRTDGAFRVEVMSPDGETLGVSPSWSGTVPPLPVREFLTPLLKPREKLDALDAGGV